MATIDNEKTTAIPDEIRATLRMGLFNRKDYIQQNLKFAMQGSYHEHVAYWTECNEELARAVEWMDTRL